MDFTQIKTEDRNVVPGGKYLPEFIVSQSVESLHSCEQILGWGES